MSGGSYDYVYRRIEDIDLRTSTNEAAQIRRDKFQVLLKLVATAMHCVEWVDSCDSGPGDEVSAIDACFAYAAEAHSGLSARELIIVSPFYERAQEEMKRQMEYWTRKIFEDVVDRLSKQKDVGSLSDGG